MRPVEALLAILRDEGVDRVFGNPGTTELPLIDALSNEPSLPYVLGLHEGAVVAMADGYARATRRPAFVSLHVAAGLANGLIGLLNARRSRTPLVVTAGQQDRRHLLADPMLSGDLVGLARAATKWAIQVEHAHDLPIVLRRAFAEAVRPPAGPVFVAIPMDLLAADDDVDVPARSCVAPVGPAGGLALAADLLAAARRPAIVAGDGVGRDEAVPELVAVADALGAAVYPQPMYDGVNFPASHPLCRGMPLPTTADIRAHLDGHDLVFIVGCHAFMAHHYTPGGPIPAGTDVLQLDSDPAEIGRNFGVLLGLVGDLAPSLQALATLLGGRVPHAQTRTAAFAGRALAERSALAAEIATLAEPPTHALAAMSALAAALPPAAVVVEEAITAGLLLRRVLRLDRPDSYVHAVGGGLGWGIGAAIGTRMATDRPVVAVLGDGCAAFGLQGLWSAARYRVPVAFVVLNNGEYRTLKGTLDRQRSTVFPDGQRSERYVGLDLRDPALDWAAAGRLFGVPTARANTAGELGELISKVGALDGPVLIDVPVSGHDARVPPVSPR